MHFNSNLRDGERGNQRGIYCGLKGAVAEWCCFPCQHPHHGSPRAADMSGKHGVCPHTLRKGGVSSLDHCDHTVLTIIYDNDEMANIVAVSAAI